MAYSPISQSVQSLSHVWLFATPWIVECQTALSITNTQSLLKFMSMESVMPSNHLILCCPLLSLPSIFIASGPFQMSQFFASGGQSIGVSASAWSCHFMANRWGNNGNSERLYFWGLQITTQDCRHEIKRYLLLARKAMTNLDSILKSRDITLSTKVHLVILQGPA